MTPEQVAPRFYGAFSRTDDIQQAIADVEADDDWMLSWVERQEDWLKFHLTHEPTNTHIEVVQEQQADGTWQSRV